MWHASRSLEDSTAERLNTGSYNDIRNSLETILVMSWQKMWLLFV